MVLRGSRGGGGQSARAGFRRRGSLRGGKQEEKVRRRMWLDPGDRSRPAREGGTREARSGGGGEVALGRGRKRFRGGGGVGLGIRGGGARRRVTREGRKLEPAQQLLVSTLGGGELRGGPLKRKRPEVSFFGGGGRRGRRGGGCQVRRGWRSKDGGEPTTRTNPFTKWWITQGHFSLPDLGATVRHLWARHRCCLFSG